MHAVGRSHHNAAALLAAEILVAKVQAVVLAVLAVQIHAHHVLGAVVAAANVAQRPGAPARHVHAGAGRQHEARVDDGGLEQVVHDKGGAVNHDVLVREPLPRVGAGGQE